MKHWPDYLVSTLAFVVLGVALVGCGSDEGTRGLQPQNEQAVPSSDMEDEMTEEERRKQMARELEGAPE